MEKMLTATRQLQGEILGSKMQRPNKDVDDGFRDLAGECNYYLKNTLHRFVEDVIRPSHLMESDSESVRRLYQEICETDAMCVGIIHDHPDSAQSSQSLVPTQ